LSAGLVKCLGVNERDYAEAWKLISTWRDDAAREALLEVHRASERRPYVVIAMIRIAAMLSKITKVTHGFAEQLTKNAYVYIEEGILNVTDRSCSRSMRTTTRTTSARRK
jgi:hypothetical protein